MEHSAPFGLVEPLAFVEPSALVEPLDLMEHDGKALVELWSLWNLLPL